MMAALEGKSNNKNNNSNITTNNNNNNGNDDKYESDDNNAGYAISFESRGIFAPVHIFSTFPINQQLSITSLNLKSNCFNYIPDEISLLCNLEVLNIAHNHIRYNYNSLFGYYQYILFIIRNVSHNISLFHIIYFNTTT